MGLDVVVARGPCKVTNVHIVCVLRGYVSLGGLPVCNFARMCFTSVVTGVHFVQVLPGSASLGVDQAGRFA